MIILSVTFFIEIVKYKVWVILQETQRTEMVFDQASGKIYLSWVEG